MMKKFLIYTVITFLFFQLNAQKVTKDKFYDKCYYNDKTFEIEGINIILRDIISDEKLLKIKLIVENNSPNIVVFDLSKITIEVVGSTYRPEDKIILLDPNEKLTEVLGIKGNGLRVHDLVLNLDGLKKAKTVGNPINIDQLDKFFAIQEKEIDRKFEKDSTYKINCKLEFKYIGNNIGFYNASKIKLKTLSGNTFETDKNPKTKLLQNNDADLVNISFDKIDKSNTNILTEKLTLMYNACFTESELITINPQKTTITINDIVTKEKN